MHSSIKELNQVYEELKSGRTAKPVSVRTFLNWFGAQRRTSSNVWYINHELAKCDIQTVPNYLNMWVDGPITFELISEKGIGQNEESTASSEDNVASNSETSEQNQKTYKDPSFKVGKLQAATRTPVSLRPNEHIKKAMTLMMARNFSQLPIMTSEFHVKGVVSWSTIGERFATNASGSDAQDFAGEHHEISINSSIFRAIQIISEYDYVLVRDAQNRISGIITANDIAHQFEETSTPFLLLSEIENHLRMLIEKGLTNEDIKSTCDPQHLPKDFSTVSDLTFGNCVFLLDHAENWNKIGLQIHKGAFIDELKELNRIRNEVMHFDPDPLKNEDVNRLRDISRLLDLLRKISSP